MGRFLRDDPIFFFELIEIFIKMLDILETLFRSREIVK